MSEPSDLEMALDLLCAMRPNVPRSSFERFMNGDPGTPYLHIDPDEIMVAVAAVAAAREESRQEAAEVIEELRRNVIAFCALWAGTYAQDHGLPDGHLHPVHYDILARCGARMDAFSRAETGEEARK